MLIITRRNVRQLVETDPATIDATGIDGCARIMNIEPVPNDPAVFKEKVSSRWNIGPSDVPVVGRGNRDLVIGSSPAKIASIGVARGLQEFAHDWG